MPKYRSQARTTVYRGDKGVRVDLDGRAPYETDNDDETAALAASPSVDEVKPRAKKKDDDS